VRSNVPVPPAGPGEVVISVDELRDWIRRGRIAAHFGRHAEARVLVHRLESVGRPLPVCLALRAMSRGRVWIEDTQGQRRTVTVALLVRWLTQAGGEPLRVSTLLRDVERAVDVAEYENRQRSLALDLNASPVYLRT